jgi:hypothetical protein
LSAASYPLPVANTNLLRPILIGGAIAGTLDLTSAFITFGASMPRGIAAGLIGIQHVRSGMFPWILGIFLHYLIAFSAATIYCLANRKLEFLWGHWLVCGIFYGIAVYLVMSFVVLPLSAFHSVGPYQLRGILQGLIAHMVLIGLPIAVSLRRFSA